MPVKISEKKLIAGIVLLAIGVYILLNATIVTVPLRLSEKGIVLAVIACGLIVAGLKSLRRSQLKV